MSDIKTILELAAEPLTAEVSDPSADLARGRRALRRRRWQRRAVTGAALAVAALAIVVASTWLPRDGALQQRSSVGRSTSSTTGTFAPPTTNEGAPDAAASAFVQRILPYRDGAVDVGFGNIALEGGPRVDLWWKGPLPSDVRAVVDAHPNVDLRLHPAKYSWAQLHAAAARVVFDAPEIRALGIRIDSVGFEEGSSGLNVTYLKEAGAQAADPSRIRAVVARMAGVDVVQALLSRATGRSTSGPLVVTSVWSQATGWTWVTGRR